MGLFPWVTLPLRTVSESCAQRLGWNPKRRAMRSKYLDISVGFGLVVGVVEESRNPSKDIIGVGGLDRGKENASVFVNEYL